MKMTDFITGQMKILKKALLKTFDEQTWMQLAKLILVRILLFNRKRTGEMGKMTVQDYISGDLRGGMNEEVRKTLSKAEQFLADRLKVIGKRGNVPVILQTALELLLKTWGKLDKPTLFPQFSDI